MSTTETPCTADQKAEWFALHHRAHELHETRSDMLRQTGNFIARSIERPDERELYERLARDAARAAIAAGGERSQVLEQIEAHPYTAEVRAHRERPR